MRASSLDQKRFTDLAYSCQEMIRDVAQRYPLLYQVGHERPRYDEGGSGSGYESAAPPGVSSGLAIRRHIEGASKSLHAAYNELQRIQFELAEAEKVIDLHHPLTIEPIDQNRERMTTLIEQAELLENKAKRIRREISKADRQAEAVRRAREKKSA